MIFFLNFDTHLNMDVPKNLNLERAYINIETTKLHDTPIRQTISIL